MTVGCAPLPHDHKYDPISQKDYYSLTSFFNNADEPGFYAPGFTGIQAGPTLPWPTREVDHEISQARSTIAAREAELLEGDRFG